MTDDHTARILAAIADLGTRFDGLETRMCGVVANPNQVRDDLRREIVDLRVAVMDVVGRLQKKIDALVLEKSVNQLTADTAMNSARYTREEAQGLYDLVATMRRTYRHLADVVYDLQDRVPPRAN